VEVVRCTDTFDVLAVLFAVAAFAAAVCKRLPGFVGVVVGRGFAPGSVIG
jgi:hypothetical protein